MDDEEPVKIPVEGVLDLHTFDPRDIKDLVSEYLEACLARGITEVRLIHGKGTGTLKRIVRSVLEKNPRVMSFRDAGPDEGAWGATTVRLRQGDGDS